MRVDGDDYTHDAFTPHVTTVTPWPEVMEQRIAAMEREHAAHVAGFERRIASLELKVAHLQANLEDGK